MSLFNALTTNLHGQNYSDEAFGNNWDNILPTVSPASLEVLNLQQDSSPVNIENSAKTFEDKDPTDESQVTNISPLDKEELVQAIRKQIKNLRERGQRMKFYVEEMVNTYPTDDETL